MLMAVTGTPNQEAKEYIFTTPLERGLSYKLVNPKSYLLKNTLKLCYKFLKKSIDRSKCSDLYTENDLVERVKTNQSDLWISVDKHEKIKGCFIIGFGEFPQSKGICAEAISGMFDFSIITPVVEKYYKALGYEFFQMTGRRGWEKIMEPLGYEFKNITIRKRP